MKGKAGRWIRHYHLKVPPPPMPPQPPRGGPRQRILPTPRGVNMIVWSLDNRFVLAAIMGIVYFTDKYSSRHSWMIMYVQLYKLDSLHALKLLVISLENMECLSVNPQVFAFQASLS